MNYEMSTRQLSLLTIFILLLNFIIIFFNVFIYLKLRNKQGPPGPPGPQGLPGKDAEPTLRKP